MTEVFAMWNWLLLAVIVGGLVALLAVAAVRQRRYAGDKPIGEQKRENFGKMEPRLPRKDRGLHGPGAEPPARLRWEDDGHHGSGDDPPNRR